METDTNTTYKALIESVDHVIKKAKNSRSGYVETNTDWEILVDLFFIWARFFPDDYDGFRNSVQFYKKENKDTKGISKSNGGMVQHQLEVPTTWWLLVTSIYPNQKFDKAFVKELSKRLSILNISGGML